MLSLLFAVVFKQTSGKRETALVSEIFACNKIYKNNTDNARLAHTSEANFCAVGQYIDGATRAHFCTEHQCDAGLENLFQFALKNFLQEHGLRFLLEVAIGFLAKTVSFILREQIPSGALIGMDRVEDLFCLGGWHARIV